MQLSTLCYVKHAGKTLMLHRVKRDGDIHQGKWNGLGGKFIPGETPEECVIREIREESGLTIKDPQMRGVLTFPEFKAGEHWMTFVFIATQFSGELTGCDEGNLEWVPDEKIKQLHLWEGDHYFLDWLQAEKFFSGKFVYKDKKLTSHEVTFYD